MLRDALGLGDAEVQEIAQHPEVRQAQDQAIEEQRQREAAQAAEAQRQEAERQQNLQHQRETAEQLPEQSDRVSQKPIVEVTESIENDRSLEAAMPKHSQVGRPTEVRVKVNLFGSQGLRLELPDYTPSGELINKSDVKENEFFLEFKVDPKTQKIQGENLLIVVSSPSFRIDEPERSIKVPPDRDSPTVNFLLVPIQPNPYGRVCVNCFKDSAKSFLMGSLILMNEILSNQEELNTDWQISSFTLEVSPNLVSPEALAQLKIDMPEIFIGGSSGNSPGTDALQAGTMQFAWMDMLRDMLRQREPKQINTPKVDRLAHLTQMIGDYQKQIAGIEKAKVTSAPEEKVRLQQRILDLKEEMRPYETEYQTLSAQAQENTIEQPLEVENQAQLRGLDQQAWEAAVKESIARAEKECLKREKAEEKRPVSIKLLALPRLQ